MPKNPHEQNEQTVRGSGGTLSTTTEGTVETDNYAHADDWTLGGGETLNPSEVIQELLVTHIGDRSLDLLLHTTGGDTVDWPHHRSTFTSDKIEIDSIEVQDPDGTGETIEGVWVGE